MLYELRIYHMHPGRLSAIHKRFRDVTMDLFQKHGIHVCDFWTDASGNETIYYVCSFKNREERDAAFARFGEDPAWKAAYEASHKDGGPIVDRIESYFMNRVEYMKPAWL